MNKKILLLTVLSLFFLRNQAQTSLTTAEDFTAIDIEGDSHTLSDYLDNGQYVLIDFFAYWCGNCCNKTPAITEVYNKYGCNTGDLAVLTIEKEGTLAQVEGFENNCGGGIAPTFVGTDDGGMIHSLYGVNNVPTFILIAPDGTIVNQAISSFSVANFDALATQYGISESNCSTTVAPTADFSASDNGLEVSFTNSSTDAVSYLWDFGDGNTSPDENPTHTYAIAGDYSVCLTATSSDGVEDMTCQTLTIMSDEVAPMANFSFSISEAEVTFTNTSTNADSYEWTFGDTNTSTEENPIHTYSASGSYEVCLLVTNMVGSNNICNTVDISLTGVEEFISESIELYPNPTRDGSQLNFELRNAQEISVLIYDVIGAKMAELSTENYSAGSHTVSLPIDDLESGQYFVSLVQAAEVVKVLKLQKVD